MMARHKNPQKIADRWNRNVSVGTEIEYLSHPGAEPQRFATKSPAQVLGDHIAVVWLRGQSGCVAVDACRRIVPVKRSAAPPPSNLRRTAS